MRDHLLADGQSDDQRMNGNMLEATADMREATASYESPASAGQEGFAIATLTMGTNFADDGDLGVVIGRVHEDFDDDQGVR